MVSAWVLDKRELVQAEEHGGSGFGHGGGSSTLKLTRPSERRLEQFLEQCRHDVQALARLKRGLARGRAVLMYSLPASGRTCLLVTGPVLDDG